MRYWQLLTMHSLLDSEWIPYFFLVLATTYDEHFLNFIDLNLLLLIELIPFHGIYLLRPIHVVINIAHSYLRLLMIQSMVYVKSICASSSPYIDIWISNIFFWWLLLTQALWSWLFEYVTLKLNLKFYRAEGNYVIIWSAKVIQNIQNTWKK